MILPALPLPTTVCFVCCVLFSPVHTLPGVQSPPSYCLPPPPTYPLPPCTHMIWDILPQHIPATTTCTHHSPILQCIPPTYPAGTGFSLPGHTCPPWPDTHLPCCHLPYACCFCTGTHTHQVHPHATHTFTCTQFFDFTCTHTYHTHTFITHLPFLHYYYLHYILHHSAHLSFIVSL